MAQVNPLSVATAGIIPPSVLATSARVFLVAVVGLGVFDTPIVPPPQSQQIINRGGGSALITRKAYKRPPKISGLIAEENECPLPALEVVVECESVPAVTGVSVEGDRIVPKRLFIKRDS